MKLYIGNMPYETSEIELREFLSEYEPIVDLHMPLDRDTGRPRGFAFVTLSNREIGEVAVNNLEGADFGGRPLRVREAEDRPRGGGGGHRGGGHRGRGGGHRGGGGGYDRGRRDHDRGGRRERDDRGGGDGKRYRSI